MTDHSNPLLQDWQTPYQLPPFEQIRANTSHPLSLRFSSSIWRKSMQLAENPAAPTIR